MHPIERVRAMLMRMVLATLVFHLASRCFAIDLNLMPCNGRRFGGVEFMKKVDPNFENSCFAFGMKIVNEATGHDFNLNEAQGIFETLLRLNPESAYPLIGYAELNMRKRELHLQGDSSFQVRDEAERATRIKPLVPASYVTLGRADLFVGC
jgi:hypothetical protein